MARTKRTVEEEVNSETTSGEVNSATTSGEVNIAVAANNDSKLITQGKLRTFANKLWDRIKNKYDRTFKEVRLSDGTTPDKKLTFTRVDGTHEEVNLRDYVRIQDKNDFKQDVSSNVGMTDGTLKLGDINGIENRGRISGHRSVTTKQFVDGYVSYLSVLTDDSLAPESRSSWTVWAVEKKTNREADVVYKKYTREAVVKEIGIGGTNYKYVDLTIEEKFDKEIYFVVGCEDRTKSYRVISLKTEYRNTDAVNVMTRPNVGDTISWETANDNIAVMVIHGRESIASLSEKINKLSPDSGLYVKQSEVSPIAGPDKVVRLDGSGKLDKNMLPSIAVNNYFQINEFSDTGLSRVTYENGDVVVVNNTDNSNHGKKYLCINKDDSTTRKTDAFIELNSKDGSVLSVNEKTGAVNLALEAADNKLKLKITGVGGATETSVDIVTDGDIDSIIRDLQD